MRIELDPEVWPAIPDNYDLRCHVEDMQDDNTVNRLDFFETDDGWCVHVTHRTSGACDAVGQTFLLPSDVSDAIAEIHGSSEDRIIWRSGLGVQVEILAVRAEQGEQP